MVERLQVERYMIASTAMNLCANIGKYSSLLYGIASVVGDKPNIERAVVSGFVYLFSGFVGHLAEGVLTCASREPLKETLDKIIEKLDIPKE